MTGLYNTSARCTPVYIQWTPLKKKHKLTIFIRNLVKRMNWDRKKKETKINCGWSLRFRVLPSGVELLRCIKNIVQKDFCSYLSHHILFLRGKDISVKISLMYKNNIDRFKNLQNWLHFSIPRLQTHIWVIFHSSSLFETRNRGKNVTSTLLCELVFAWNTRTLSGL